MERQGASGRNWGGETDVRIYGINFFSIQMLKNVGNS